MLLGKTTPNQLLKLLEIHFFLQSDCLVQLPSLVDEVEGVVAAVISSTTIALPMR